MSSVMASESSFSVNPESTYVTACPWELDSSRGLHRRTENPLGGSEARTGCSGSSSYWEPEQTAMIIAKYLSFGLVDPYKDAESPAGIARRGAEAINAKRGRMGMNSLAWSHRLHQCAAKQAKNLAEAQRTSFSPKKGVENKIEKLLGVKVGKVRELVHVTHSTGQMMALEVAEQWLAETCLDTYSCLGIGVAKSKITGQYVFVAYLITEAPEWLHQFYSIDRLGERPEDSVFWSQTVV